MNTRQLTDREVRLSNRGPTVRFRRLGLTLFVAALVALPGIGANAKSVYLIADINASPTPIETYNINPDGTLTFQASASVPALAGGAVGIALDSASETLFITYEVSNVIQLVDARTFAVLSQVTAPGAANLAGVAFDQELQLVYTVDRYTPTLYVYEWDAMTTTLSLVAGFPINLTDAVSLFGIALDEINDILYVADSGFTLVDSAVRYYDTATWTKLGEFSPSLQPIGIAVDPVRGFVYTGGFFFGSDLLSQYDINAEMEITQSVSAGIGDGVVGLAVDVATGLVYASRGYDSAGDDLTVWDTSSVPFVLVDDTDRRGDVTGVVVPFDEVSFNPLNLSKTDSLDDELGECVVSGQNVVYEICYDNGNAFDVDNVIITDTIPTDAVFVSATNGGVVGTGGDVEWAIGALTAGTAEQCVQLTLQLTGDPLSMVTNTVSIQSDQTPVTTTSDDTLVCETPPITFVDLIIEAEGGGGSIGLAGLLALFAAGVAGLRRRTGNAGRGIVSMTLVLMAATLLIGVQPAYAASNGWYAGASVGAADADFDAGDLTALMTAEGYTINNVDTDSSDTGFKIFAGYNFTPNWGVEAAWVDLGEIESRFGTTVEDTEVPAVLDATARVHGYLADGVALSGIGRYPISQQVSVYARAGVFFWEAEAEAMLVSGGTGTVSVSDDGTDFMWGVGVDYEVSRQWTVRAEYERYGMDRNDADLWSIGVQFNF